MQKRRRKKTKQRGVAYGLTIINIMSW